MSELKEIGIRWEENGELHFSHVYLKSEADKVIAHNKYKRCLAMANWCFDEGKGTPTVYEVRTFYWGRWGNIWLALAEEPTWAKFLQLIRKEAK